MQGHQHNKIDRDKRHEIFEFLTEANISYLGGFSNEVNFLDPIFDLRKLPSKDSRYKNAHSDIYTHGRSGWHDYEDNPTWVFDDDRFNLMGCEDELFLKFLCRTLHYGCGREITEHKSMLSFYNDMIGSCGYRIVQDGERSIYIFENLLIGEISSPTMSYEQALHQRSQKMNGEIELNPTQAIGDAKDFIESACKDVLIRHEDFTKEEIQKLKFPQLTKEVLKVLQLTPENITDEIRSNKLIKGVLSNLSSLSYSLSQIRNIHGAGHGKESRHTGLEARHARLAVNSAITFVEFILSREIDIREKEKGETKKH